jgi:serine protease Do
MGEQVKELFSWARRRKILATFFVTLTLAVGILIGSVVSGRTSAMKSLGFGGTTATPLTVPDPIPATNSFAAIVNKVEPAVVNIATTQVMERRQTKKRRAQPNDQDDPMQDFFDRFFDGRQDGPPQAERSLGSGVIVDKRGYILTNNHVVEQATKIQVQLNGETTRYAAKLVGVDEDTDLAVIKIDANKDLPTAKLGNSDGVQVGDWQPVWFASHGDRGNRQRQRSRRNRPSIPEIFADRCGHQSGKFRRASRGSSWPGGWDQYSDHYRQPRL